MADWDAWLPTIEPLEFTPEAKTPFTQFESQMRLAWVEIHRDDLMADWELAINGQQPFKIEPLR